MDYLAATAAYLRPLLLQAFVLIQAVRLGIANLPCVYQGHLVSNSDWYGFLANITILNTGRITFEFSFPASSCCQNVLFYTEEQLYILNSRMNCWQKEGLVRPEEDQILRLTPSFPWSGCHLVYVNSVAMYSCVGGRSFKATSNRDTPTTYFIAVSNCAQIHGLDIKYRIELVGHVGDCIGGYTFFPTRQPLHPNNGPITGKLTPNEKDSKASNVNSCAIQNHLNTSLNWYGFVANVTIKANGRWRFNVSFPYIMTSQQVLFYTTEDVNRIMPGFGCWLRFGVIRDHSVQERIMYLHEFSDGCYVHNKTDSLGIAHRYITCQGEKHFTSDMRIHIAFCNCRSERGMVVDYKFMVFNYKDYVCSDATRTQRSISWFYILLVVIVAIGNFVTQQHSVYCLRLHIS